MMLTHKTEQKCSYAFGTVIGMSSYSAKITTYSCTFAYAGKRAGIAYREIVGKSVYCNGYRTVKMRENFLFPRGIFYCVK